MPVPGPTMMMGASGDAGNSKPDGRTKTHAEAPGASTASCVEHTPSLVRPSAPRIGSRSTLTVRCTRLGSETGEDEIV